MAPAEDVKSKSLWIISWAGLPPLIVSSATMTWHAPEAPVPDNAQRL